MLLKTCWAWIFAHVCVSAWIFSNFFSIDFQGFYFLRKQSKKRKLIKQLKTWGPVGRMAPSMGTNIENTQTATTKKYIK